jgi:hypothetical protein
MIAFEKMRVKGVTANVGKGTITLSFECLLDDESMALAQELGMYAADEMKVNLVVNPSQLLMAGMEMRTKKKEEGEE